MSEFYYVFSGMENMTKNIININEKTSIKINAIMFSYPWLRERWGNNIKKDIEKLKEQGVKIWLDSGAAGIRHVYAMLNKGKGGSSIKGENYSEKMLKMIKENRVMGYVDSYVKFVRENADLFDYIVELDIPALIGEDKVWEVREELSNVKGKESVIIVYHKDDYKSFDSFVSEMREKGYIYLGLTGLELKEKKYIMKAKKYANEGIKFHGFGYGMISKRDMEVMFSIDATNWNAVQRFGMFTIEKGNKLEGISREEIVKVKSELHKVVKDCNVIGIDIDSSFKNKDWRNLTICNLLYIQKVISKWVSKDDINYVEIIDKLPIPDEEKDRLKVMVSNEVSRGNGIPKWVMEAKRIMESGEKFPSWIGEKDNYGRPKVIYLKTRYGNYKHGAYARVLHTYALTCDNCPVADKCPMYQEGSLCYFIPFWRSIGNTRNKEQVINVMERVVQEKYMRYMRARYFEDLEGGILDKSVSKLEDDLLKSLELLIRVKYGGYSNVNIYAMGKDSEMNLNLDFGKAYEDIEKEYGEELAKKVREKIKLADSER